MRFFTRTFVLLLCCLGTRAGIAQALPHPKENIDSLLQKFFVQSDLPAATEEAESRLRRAPADPTALFVRMETAELQERVDLVLDSALRLCRLSGNSDLQEIASNRVLQHAANTSVFNSFLRRIRLAAALNTACTSNLRLALVAAATDGDSAVDLDQATHAAGLVTHWRIAGPFGHYSNVDFERRWSPEADQLAKQQYRAEQLAGAEINPVEKKTAAAVAPAATVRTEQFWFRDGMIALPEYFSSPGIFYAAGDVDVAMKQASQLEVLSSGTYSVLVDGQVALLHDTRYSAGASRDSSRLTLSPGHHRIMVKFTADSSPLSVSLHPQSQSPQLQSTPQRGPGVRQSLTDYARKLLAYFHGDFAGLERMLASENVQGAAYTTYFRALLYTAAEDHSSRADAAWKSVATAQPAALLARLKYAQSAVERGQEGEVRQEVMQILAARPQSETALQLAFHLSRNNQAEAPALLERLLHVHPSCAQLLEAMKFHSSIAEQDKAQSMELQLATCAPESLQYARILSDSGRHSAAAAYLQQIIARNPLHRAARRLLVEQLVLENQMSAAKLQAGQLSDLAPNARRYASLAEDPRIAQDSTNQRASGFARNSAFYLPYRREGVDVVRKSAARSFSGGAAIVLLSDKTIELRHDGSASVYIHRLTRPLNKEGISSYGEVTLPRGADLLELRTIKSTGEIIEPELAQQKATISMPALEPGDTIEEEFVMNYADLSQAPESVTSLTFGSFSAPVLYSRLVLLHPADSNPSIREWAAPPQPLVGENNGTVVRIWERNNIAQTVAEPFLPSSSLLPTVSVAAEEITRDRLRDALIDATRAGLHVNESATEVDLAQATSEVAKATRLYRYVTAKVEFSSPNWAGNPAEDTLLNRQGSRTSTLLALARTAGLHAGLLLAHKVDRPCARGGDISCYTEPLVRFWFTNGETVDVDAEPDDLPFGAVPPSLETREALLVPQTAEEATRQAMVALATKQTQEKSVAEGDLSFHQEDLVARIQVRMGTARAQEVRSLLRNASERERQAFFEQLALRIFAGATGVTGSASNEGDPERPLELSFSFTVPQFINQSGPVDLDQFAPALGLRTLYAKSTTRKFPLFIDSLFFDSTVFHVHLPEGLDVRSLPPDFYSKSEFGEYTLKFVRSAEKIDVRRDFRIPVQVITPEKYAAFADFARRIDEAERQRISLEPGRGGPPMAQTAPPPLALKMKTGKLKLAK